MEIRFDGKRALVTGSGKGIGREIIKKLAKCGAECIALSRTQEDLDSLKTEVCESVFMTLALGVPGIQTIRVDLADWTETRQAIESLGQIDLLVNNAAAFLMCPFLDTSEEEIDRIFDVNFKGVFNVSQVVARGMIERGNGGAIVNVSSNASMIGIKTLASYCSSKGALDSLTRVMATELGPHKIRVNSVNPAVVNAGMGIAYVSDPKNAENFLPRIPLGKYVGQCENMILYIPCVSESEDVANAVSFLLSDKAGSVNGICMLVDGGLAAN
ncbi:hypothetical protein CHS0354_031774 [Potamilus streckersoni]|uniref:L-xylulose reductase n=1 Tax=Potamilus streckersoni TaxID=2493646 RepID=A0AAE0RXQ0_9BIVA|nr:hypothetical protein CHS0354_031774 [Potamilus streckersoni]